METVETPLDPPLGCTTTCGQGQDLGQAAKSKFWEGRLAAAGLHACFDHYMVMGQMEFKGRGHGWKLVFKN